MFSDQDPCLLARASDAFLELGHRPLDSVPHAFRRFLGGGQRVELILGDGFLASQCVDAARETVQGEN
jgi:hypothetical protein